MARLLYKIVLFLLLGMALLSPFMQMNSMDEFPVKGDDFELWVISCLCGIGILLLLGKLLQTVPVFWRLGPPSLSSYGHSGPASDAGIQAAPVLLVIPLRI